jgi:uncharacterized Tic20 family protein
MIFKTKWDRFYDNQNPTTQAWLDAQAKETTKFTLAIGIPIFTMGLLVGFIVGLGV